MIITEQTLIHAGACHGGVKDFRKFFPSGFDTNFWTLELQIKILKKTRLKKYIAWAWHKSLIPMWSLSGANIEGADLGRANWGAIL
jgi:hypothetical protein